ncbi:MAG: DNA-3-methyladenine glycosylase [Candidatus Accumulibacter sp.]|nr:DNA-3-methyladenine glycosylase [Accumulibacter sp.]
MSMPAYWKRASSKLAKGDPVMAGFVKRYAKTSLVSRGDPFSTLARSIVGQQISVKAADAIWSRFAALFPVLVPENLLGEREERLRECGLSARKVEYLRDLSRRFADGDVCPERWPDASDEEIIAELTAVRGIGVWTVEMFLIFNLMRPDVFPVDDIGLQRAVALHYFEGERPSRKELVAFGERWRPWRTVATWYLWRSLDPIPVEY